jgi:PAT family beta-lactamase induction signal transducer AmpG
MFGLIRSMLGGLPQISYAESAARLGIDPASLGAGYIVFFLYTGVLGIAGVLLAMAVAWRERSVASDVPSPAAAVSAQLKQ